MTSIKPTDFIAPTIVATIAVSLVLFKPLGPVLSILVVLSVYIVGFTDGFKEASKDDEL